MLNKQQIDQYNEQVSDNGHDVKDITQICRMSAYEGEITQKAGVSAITDRW